MKIIIQKTQPESRPINWADLSDGEIVTFNLKDIQLESGPFLILNKDSVNNAWDFKNNYVTTLGQYSNTEYKVFNTMTLGDTKTRIKA